jgi:quinol-cytochrome oxidoreductase complex cytochrome b subunit/mono/diheme cytochrome c family protein
VLASLKTWWQNRTGTRKVFDLMLLEHIPGGAKWRYVWGSTLAFVFGLQLITGLMLVAGYSPGASTAWSSVYHIQYQMDFGWLIRGLHHFGSQAMVVLMALHMLQVVIAGAQLPPREINWWLGLGLMAAVLGLSLTGYLLPWDQKGFWATQVATNIAGNLPGVGPFIQKLAVGGPAYGHHTLTRFYALHVGILPAIVIVLLVLHIALFRRHGVTTPAGSENEEGGWFWPDQAFRDLVACLLIFAVMLGLVLVGHGHSTTDGTDMEGYQALAHAGQRGLGANLDAPADPSDPYPARPEWYFLFLFQLLKYFEGDQEVIATVVIPNGVLLLLAVLPLLGYGAMRRVGQVFGVLVVMALFIGVGALTCLALADDMTDPVNAWVVRQVGLVLLPVTGAVLLLHLGFLGVLPHNTFRSIANLVGTGVVGVLLAGSGVLLFGAFTDRLTDPVVEQAKARMTTADEQVSEKAVKFQEERADADKKAKRALVLAEQGVPEEGATHLLRRDPMTQGPRLFQDNCASCHTHGKEIKDGKEVENQQASASDLKGFGTEEWIYRLLRDPGANEFFGRYKDPERTTMTNWILDYFPNVNLTAEQQAKLPEEERKQVEKDLADLKKIAAWLGKHPRPDSPDRDSPEFQEGLKLFQVGEGGRGCAECHTYAGEGGKQGPDLTGYGDEDWLRLMIMAPYDPSRYGNKNAMPIFRDLEGKDGPLARQEIARMKQLLLDQIDPESRRAERDKKRIEEAYKRLMQLNDVDRELIIRWLLGDGRVVFGGSPITGPVKGPEE